MSPLHGAGCRVLNNHVKGGTCVKPITAPHQGLICAFTISSMAFLPSLHHHHHQPLHLSLTHRHSTPFSSFSFLSLPPPPSSSTPFRLSSIRASHSPNKSPSFHKPQSALTHVFKTLDSFCSPFLKTTCFAAALFLMRLHLNPRALAAEPLLPPPLPTAETVSTPENLLVKESNSNSDSVEALQSVIETKVNEGKFDEAIRVVDRLTKLEPEELDWPLLKAHLYARNGDHVSARDSYEGVLKRDPFNVESLHGILMASSELKEPTKGLLPRFEEALRFFEREKRDSEIRDLKLLIAQIKVLEWDLSGALKVYEELVQQEPKDFRLYLCQGVVYTMMKKKDEAERQFDKFRELIPEDHPYREYFEENADDFLQKLGMGRMSLIGKR